MLSLNILKLVISVAKDAFDSLPHDIAGKVTSHKGRIQIQIGSSWGKIERINGEEVR